MSSFNPGTGTLSATNLPSAFLELASLLQLAESAVTPNPPDNLNLTSDIDNQSFAINANLPISATVSSSGSASIEASDYVVLVGGDSTFDNTGSDLQSTNLVSALLEVATLLHSAEKAAPAPEPNNIQITYNLENGTADINASLPQTIAIVNGKLTITATDYV